MDKLYRRNQILDLLRHGTVGTQEDLCARLAQRGVHVTQATISRDIEELGLVKTRDGYRAPETASPAAPPPQPSLAVILKEFLRDVRLASNFVVVKTHPGNAHSVAAALDAESWPEVAGTVAGDDTIFIATSGARDALRLRRKLLAIVAG